MAALESDELQNIARAGLAPQGDQPAGPSVLPPFSGKLNVDKGLKLRCENLKQFIDDFYKEKENITPLNQLTETPAFPTPHVLAQFASKTYEDYKTGETDAQYETRLELPVGWKLLTAASNSSNGNGYFGAAYWIPDHQQVVIAHRGTANLGALWTDVVGVLFKHHVSQMCSASTFAHKVVEVLREVNRKKGVSFELFFTGHSLGRWLAQITTFTTEYLKREENLFLRSNADNDCYHPHTVVFDSPGCRDMLLQMRDTFDVRHDGRSIDLEQLDISSYLSAPNRINTCNACLGTVYRIFTDLSDMSSLTGLRGTVYRFFSYLSDMAWRKKLPACYNIETHRMEKIVEAFDPETGQVFKDEEGQLKVQVVIDWPLSAGLTGGEEYKSFFEWAEKLNNYQPEIKDVCLGDLNFCPFRYQTKLYDERVNSLRIFSEEEQEVLQFYVKLRRWPEFWKSKELFSVMEDNQAKENAEEILQNYEIVNDTISCTDSSALQALVPYVKRLLSLFPQIKEFGKRVLQCETKRCIERICQSPMEFNSDSSSFKEFLESEQQQVMQVQMVDGDEWTGLIKVYQLLQQTNCLNENQYTVLKLERMLTVNMLLDFSSLRLSSEAQYVILVACKANELLRDETKDMIRTIFKRVKQEPCIKIILTTRSEDRAAHFLQHTGREIFRNGFVTRDEQLAWSDLTSSSQEKLLGKSIKFQESNVPLKELMSAECPVTDFLPLGDLLDDKELKIADPLPISNAYNERYYIGRTLRHQVAVKKDIFRDKEVQEKNVLLAGTEREFKQLCQLHPQSNVHWLVEGKSGKLLWKRTQGSLETVRRYIDTESSPTYTADDLDKLLEQAEHQRVMLISDTAGMGKSTVLTHLSKQIKQKSPAKWVVRIDLNDYTDELRALKKEEIDKKKAIEFISEKVLKLKPGVEIELFKQCCEQNKKVRIVIMLDGFDEISPFYKERVIDLLQALRLTTLEQLWVTTRPHLRNELEDKLQQLSYTLEPFSEKDQIEFLTNFWSLQDWFTEPHVKEEEAEKCKLEIFAVELIKKLSKSVSDKDRQLTGIPLLTRMLAEAFDKEVRTICQSAEPVPELQFKLDLLELYRSFIERKYDIYLEEKLQLRASNAAGIEERKDRLTDMIKDHQLLALKVLFDEEILDFFLNDSRCKFSAENLTRIGIVQVSDEGKPHLIHRTFAEYLVADYLVDSLTDGNNTSEQVQTFILQDIIQKKNIG